MVATTAVCLSLPTSTAYPQPWFHFFHPIHSLQATPCPSRPPALLFSWPCHPSPGDPWRATPEPASAPGPAVVSRFFAPWMGINEDPVTGSAHAVLGPYWEPRLRGPGAEGPGEPAGPGVGAGIGVGQGGASGPMRMRQCSARGGDLLVEVLRPEGPGDVKVRVSGAATLVMSGTMVV